MGADEIIALARTRVVLATGARWTDMSTPRWRYRSAARPSDVLTRTTLPAAGSLRGPPGFRFDNYNMGGALTEHLPRRHPGHLRDPSGQASAWTIMTNELPLVHRALARRKVP